MSDSQNKWDGILPSERKRLLEQFTSIDYSFQTWRELPEQIRAEFTQAIREDAHRSGLPVKPRGGDVVRMKVPWKWAGDMVRPNTYGFIGGDTEADSDSDVQITFNSQPFVGRTYMGPEVCSASGGPGTISTPVWELRETGDTVKLDCWRWKNGVPEADNGDYYKRTCRIWDWYPSTEPGGTNSKS